MTEPADPMTHYPLNYEPPGERALAEILETLARHRISGLKVEDACAILGVAEPGLDHLLWMSAWSLTRALRVCLLTEALDPDLLPELLVGESWIMPLSDLPPAPRAETIEERLARILAERASLKPVLPYAPRPFPLATARLP